MIVRMHQIDPRCPNELADAPTKALRPRRVHHLQISVESRDAEQVEREVEKPVALFLAPRARSASSAGRTNWPPPPQKCARPASNREDLRHVRRTSRRPARRRSSPASPASTRSPTAPDRNPETHGSAGPGARRPPQSRIGSPAHRSRRDTSLSSASYPMSGGPRTPRKNPGRRLPLRRRRTATR